MSQEQTQDKSEKQGNRTLKDWKPEVWAGKKRDRLARRSTRRQLAKSIGQKLGHWQYDRLGKGGKGTFAIVKAGPNKGTRIYLDG